MIFLGVLLFICLMNQLYTVFLLPPYASLFQL